MTDIWELVKSVKKAITDTVAQLQSKKDDVAKRFTGVDLVSMLHDCFVVNINTLDRVSSFP